MNKIFKNSIFSILRLLVITPIFFVMVPYMLDKIGEEGLGIWTLVFTISSYQVFVDMGLTSALIRYVAKERLLGNYTLISGYLATSLVVYLLIGSLVFFLIFIFKTFIVTSVFNIHTEVDIAEKLLIISALSATINLNAGLFKSLIDGIQRMDVSNILLIAQSIISAGGIFLFLELGYGLMGLGVNALISSFIILFSNVYFSKRFFPEYTLNFRLANRERFKEMFSYSANLQLASLLRFWIEPLNKILIANFFSVTFVYFYETALKFTNQLQNFIVSIGLPVFPAASEIEHSSIEKIENLRIKSTKYILYSSTLFCSVLIFIVPDFVKLWLGPNLEIIGNLIRIFTVGTFFISLALIPYIILNGLGFAKDTLLEQVHSGIANLVGIIVFTYFFSFYGFCIGFTLSFIYGFFITNYYYEKRFQNKINIYRSFLNKKYIIFLIVLLGLECLLYTYMNINTYFDIILYCLILGILFCFLLWKLDIINKKELKSLLGRR